MARYKQTFTKTIHGFFEVEAVSPEEAEEIKTAGEFDEFDNK